MKQHLSKRSTLSFEEQNSMQAGSQPESSGGAFRLVLKRDGLQARQRALRDFQLRREHSTE